MPQKIYWFLPTVTTGTKKYYFDFTLFQSNLDYPDFSIIRTWFSGPSFSWILLTHILCPQQNFFSFKLCDETPVQTEFVSLQSIHLNMFRAHTHHDD